MLVNCKQTRDFGERNFWPGMILLFISMLSGPIGAETKHALLIGIDDYSISGLENLKGPANDLRLIKNVLLANLGFKEQDIIVLKNKQATHILLEKAFSKLAYKINDGDLVYIHYCGHGSQVPDKDGDESPGLFDQTWVPYGSRSTRMRGKNQYDIIDDELHEWLIPLFDKTDNIVIVSDSCYAAGVTRGNILSARSVSPDYRHYPLLRNVPVKKDFIAGIAIGAAQDDELAFEAIFNEEIHGLFSWFWSGALKKSRPGDTWSDLFQQTYIMVDNYFDQQHPKFQGDLDKSVFGNDNKKKPPRIPISKVWHNGQKVRIEAGSLSGVCTGSLFRLYNPLAANNPGPLLEITKVTPFYSEAAAKGNGDFVFKIGDLVCAESFEKMINANQLKKLASIETLGVNLAITLWRPTEKPVMAENVYLELPDNLGWFAKQGIFSPAEMEAKQVFPLGSLLTFQIKNNNRRDCYIYLLDIRKNERPGLIFPTDGNCRLSALLPAGCELDLKDMVSLLLDRPGKEVIKLIVTEAPISLAFFRSEASRMIGKEFRKNWVTTQVSITIVKKL